MNGSNNITNPTGLSDQRITLTANKPYKLPVPGDYFLIREAVQQIMVKASSGAEGSGGAGTGFPILYAYIEILSAVDQTVTVALGFIGGLAPPIQPATVNVGSISLPTSTSNQLRNPPDKTCLGGIGTRLLTADPARLKVTLKLPDDAPAGMRLGASDVAADRGLPVEAGSTLEESTAAELWLFVPGAADVVVAILEGMKV